MRANTVTALLDVERCQERIQTATFRSGLVCGGGLLRWWDSTGNREVAQAAPPYPLVSATLIDKGPPGRILSASAEELAVCCADESGRVEILARHPSPVP